jgi:hypothetical protein
MAIGRCCLLPTLNLMISKSIVLSRVEDTENAFIESVAFRLDGVDFKFGAI